MNTVIKAFLPNYLRILLNLGNFKMKFVKWKGENQNSHLLKKQLRIIIKNFYAIIINKPKFVAHHKIHSNRSCSITENLNNKSLKKMTHLK